MHGSARDARERGDDEHERHGQAYRCGQLEHTPAHECGEARAHEGGRREAEEEHLALRGEREVQERRQEHRLAQRSPAQQRGPDHEQDEPGEQRSGRSDDVRRQELGQEARRMEEVLARRAGELERCGIQERDDDADDRGGREGQSPASIRENGLRRQDRHSDQPKEVPAVQIRPDKEERR